MAVYGGMVHDALYKSCNHGGRWNVDLLIYGIRGKESAESSHKCDSNKLKKGAERKLD